MVSSIPRPFLAAAVVWLILFSTVCLLRSLLLNQPSSTPAQRPSWVLQNTSVDEGQTTTNLLLVDLNDVAIDHLKL